MDNAKSKEEKDFYQLVFNFFLKERAKREEIYSAMIVYGLLSYYDRIPNKEFMKEFEKALKDEFFKEVMTIVKNSSNMLKAT
jgi:hypothetical protein